MKSTTMARKVDDLGRVLIPMQLRRILDIDEKTPIEIFTQGNAVILKKYEPCCTFCGKNDELMQFQGRKICKSCLQGLKQL